MTIMLLTACSFAPTENLPEDPVAEARSFAGAPQLGSIGIYCWYAIPDYESWSRSPGTKEGMTGCTINLHLRDKAVSPSAVGVWWIETAGHEHAAAPFLFRGHEFVWGDVGVYIGAGVEGPDWVWRCPGDAGVAPEVRASAYARRDPRNKHGFHTVADARRLGCEPGPRDLS